jgi:hypothetical protein
MPASAGMTKELFVSLRQYRLSKKDKIMKQYFEKMDPLGKPLSAKQIESMQENCAKIE